MPHLLLKDLPPYACLLAAQKDFPEMDPSSTEAFMHLLKASDEVFAIHDRHLAENNISQGRFCVLMILWGGKEPEAAVLMGGGTCASGPRTPAALAEAAGVTRATMTGLIDTLERDGYVKREADKTDRRMLTVLLTEKGETFLRNLLPAHFKISAAVMSALDENERKILVTLLNKVVQQTATMRGSAAIAEHA